MAAPVPPAAAPAAARSPYLDPCFETLFEAYYQELLSTALVRRWQTVDLITKGLVAATTSGSTIAGLSFWSESFWQPIWASIAAVAAIASVVYSVMEVTAHVKNQEGTYRSFSALRTDLETFHHHLRVGMINQNDAMNRYEDLRSRFREATTLAPPDILETENLRNAVQQQVESNLETKGYY